MELLNAVGALGALAQQTRLAVFRLLVRAGPDGVAAGAIASRIGVEPATLSFHLKELVAAGLLTARRESRQIFYAADYDGVRALLAYLTEDCCQGRPEFCATPPTVTAARAGPPEQSRREV